MKDEKSARVPIIPLDYNRRELAVKKELLIDYQTGNIYVVSPEDKTIVIDITAKIASIINEKYPGDIVEVTIEGIGKVNLTEYLNSIKKNNLKAVSKDEKYLIPDAYYDNLSITNKDGKIEINDFDEAEESDVPYKDKDGVIRWGNPKSLDDVKKVEVKDSTCTLNAKYCETDIGEGCFIKPVADARFDYNVIYWKVNVADVVPYLKFPTGINYILKYSSDLNLKPNSTAIYTFQSWDKGNTWYVKVDKYMNDSDSAPAEVDEEYALTNFFTKEEIKELLRWKANSSTPINM